MSDYDWPPTFSVDMDDRQEALLNCYELMEQLTDEHGGRGRIVRVDESTCAVVLEYDLPEP